jgi:hypothetical protein
LITPGQYQASRRFLQTARFYALRARYVCGLLRAAEWATAHPDAAWRVIAAEVGVAEEWAQAACAPQTVTDLRPRIADDLLDTLQNRSDFRHSHGFIPRPVDVRAWLDPPARVLRAHGPEDLQPQPEAAAPRFVIRCAASRRPQWHLTAS